MDFTKIIYDDIKEIKEDVKKITCDMTDVKIEIARQKEKTSWIGTISGLIAGALVVALQFIIQAFKSGTN